MSRGRKQNIQRSFNSVTGRGVRREDSDDELGYEDLTWEWIYSRNNDQDSQHIQGAQFGSFRCFLGDCVLLKAESAKEAWVAIICEFGENETDGEKEANFMWFSTEKEIRNKDKKRTDFLKNELYICPDFDWNPLASINGSAKVMSPSAFKKSYPSGLDSIKSKDRGKIFVCRRGCNLRTATYTEEFTWEDVYHGSESIYDLVQKIQTQTKATRRKRQRTNDDGEANDELNKAESRLQSTPSKKRKLQQATTPESKSKSVARTPQQLSTPAHKRIVVKKPLEFTPLGTRILSPSNTTSSPFQIARNQLHVSSVPTALPCREEAFMTVYSHLEAAISDGSGSCIYISGTPGTGKTATVREVVTQLNAAVQSEELDDFIFVEINGMKVTDPHQAYSLLWEALQGDRVSPSHALDLLDREFNNPSPRRVPCVVLMDELDQLVTKNQSVMYNFFNWPGLRHSRLIVLAVANTMDLPERTLSNKISSRLGLTRITFPGYTHEQLMKIIQCRLGCVPGNIVDSDAIQFASRKVAAVSGDARRALDICRRAVEIAEAESREQDPAETTPSKKSKYQREAQVTDQVKHGRVVIGTIKQAIDEATSTPLQQCLKQLPLASKLFLAATLARARRSGIPEVILGDVLDEARGLGRMADEPALQQFLLSNAESDRKLLGSKELALSTSRMLALGAAAIELAEAGVIGLEQRKGERTGKVRIKVSEEEARLALKNDPEVRGLGLSG